MVMTNGNDWGMREQVETYDAFLMLSLAKTSFMVNLNITRNRKFYSFHPWWEGVVQIIWQNTWRYNPLGKSWLALGAGVGVMLGEELE